MLKDNINSLNEQIVKLAHTPINDNTAKALSVYGAARAELQRLYDEQTKEEMPVEPVAVTSEKLPVSEDNVKCSIDKEYADIQPRYHEYCDVKREYQLNNIPVSALETSVVYLCKEIKEFMQVLYSNSDTEFEKTAFENVLREMLDSMVL